MFHDNIIASGNYVEHTVELRPLVEIQSRAIIQTVTWDDNQLLHIIELPSDGIIIVTPVSYLMDALKETNIKVIDLCAYYANVKNGNTNLLTSAIHGICTKLDDYPQMCLVCNFCWTDTDSTHYNTFWPILFLWPRLIRHSQRPWSPFQKSSIEAF